MLIYWKRLVNVVQLGNEALQAFCIQLGKNYPGRRRSYTLKNVLLILPLYRYWKDQEEGRIAIL